MPRDLSHFLNPPTARERAARGLRDTIDAKAEDDLLGDDVASQIKDATQNVLNRVTAINRQLCGDRGADAAAPQLRTSEGARAGVSLDG